MLLKTKPQIFFIKNFRLNFGIFNFKIYYEVIENSNTKKGIFIISDQKEFRA